MRLYIITHGKAEQSEKDYAIAKWFDHSDLIFILFYMAFLKYRIYISYRTSSYHSDIVQVRLCVGADAENLQLFSIRLQ